MPGDAAREVRGERQLVERLRAGQHVVVVGDEVELVRPRGVVHALRLAHDHEVRRHGHVRRDAAQDLRLGAQVLAERVGREALEVELLGRVRVRRGEPRREDLLPRAVALRPERGAPRGVERVERRVAVAQPRAEGRGRVVGEVVDVVAAELVRHVPGDERRVVAVPLGPALDAAQRELPEDRRRRAPLLPRARPQGLARAGLRQDLRVLRRQPRRRRGGRRREVDRDAVRVEQVHRVVEPREVPRVLGRLDAGPREDRERDHRHAGLAHEAHVLVPDLARPLVRVVVRAVGQARRRVRAGLARRRVRPGTAQPAERGGGRHACS